MDNGGLRYPIDRRSNFSAMPKGGYTNIVSEAQTNLLMIRAANKISSEYEPYPLGIQNINQIKNWSPNGAPWDFKPQRDYLNPNSLYIMNGVAQQYEVAGNALWGAGMKAIGVPEWEAKLAAQAASLRDNNLKFDDPREQDAISYAYRASAVTSSPDESFFATDETSSSAAGRSLLYPNKPNTNMMRSVYGK